MKFGFRKSYLLIFSLIIILTTVSTFYIQQQINISIEDPELINISGQQRMLSQRIAFSIQNVFLATTHIEHTSSLKMLTDSLETFKLNHLQLTQTLPNTEYIFPLSSAVKKLYFNDDVGLDGLSKAYSANAEQYLAHKFENNQTLQPFDSQSADLLLAKLDSSVSIHAQEAQLRASSLSNMGYLLWSSELIILVFSALFIFFPIEKMVLKSGTRTRFSVRNALRIRKKSQKIILNNEQLITEVGRELKTPIINILGLLELAAYEQNKTFRDQQISKAKIAGYDQLQLLNNILDTSKIEAKGFTLEVTDCNLLKLLDECMVPVSNACNRKKLKFIFTAHSPIPEYVQCDPIRFSQVINSLLSNAVKFTENGNVLVDLYMTKTISGFDFKLSVEDTGIGIATSELKHIFEKFSQTSQQNLHSYKGVRLSLTMAKKITKKMNGRIHVTSTESKGSHFTLKVKLKTSSREQLKVDPVQGSHNVSFAIVDQLETSRLYLASLLESEGFKVQIFTSGAKLLKNKEHLNSYAAVIIDLQIQGISAHEIAGTVNAIYAEKAPKFVFISASDELINAIPVGFTDLHYAFVKPLDKTRFLDSIRSITQQDPTQNKLQRPISILLVEDEPISAEIVSMMLKNKGHDVKLAYTGKQAIDMAKSEPFDLILMDIHLPDFSGIEVTTTIKDKLGLSTPIIALTAGGSEEDILKTHNAGMKYHLVKPVQAHELHSVINLVII
ncbi:MAG: signal transduction histidine kinase/CheY-like chemotaxis protein [Paraglaciecola sp.]